jgi:cytochrome b561
MSGLRRTGKMSSALRLNFQFRWALYTAFAVLFITGVVWMIANAQKDSPDAEFWQTVAADLLMIHGGATMVTLVLLGALIPTHILRAWVSRKNQLTGTVMAISNILLITTAFGLYYAGSDTLRAWISDVHIAVGIAFPVLLTAHVLTGRTTQVPPPLI